MILLTLVIFLLGVFKFGSGLMFVQQSIVTIPWDYPVGASIYHVTVIDEVTGRRPEGVRFGISKSRLIKCSPRGKSYATLFAVDSQIGTLLVSPHQSASLQEYSGCTVALYIQAIGGSPKRNATLVLPITVMDKNHAKLQDNTCEPKQEMCFGPFDFAFYIPETTATGTAIGNIKPLGHRKSCPGIKNTYTVESQTSVLPVEVTTGELRLLQPLDFEKEREYNFTISCESNYDIDNSTVSAIFAKNASMRVVDVNDNAPYLQLGTRPFIELDVSDITPGKKIPAHFNVIDDDSLKVNNIKIQLNDPLQLFQKKNTVAFDRSSNTLINTEIFARKPFSFDGESYNFSVTFHDKSLINATENQHVSFHVTVYNRTRQDPVQFPKDWTVMASISYRASQHARIIQPIDVEEKDGYLFQLMSFENTTDGQQIFGVTPRTGIIYLKEASLLSMNPNHTYHLTLTWTYKQTSDFECTVVIRVVDSGRQYVDCDNEDSQEQYLTCARHSEESHCNGSCGRAVRDGSCQWRTGSNNSIPTALYATCSPDLATCPDGRCDELEAMDPNICPQDCASVVVGTGYLSHSGRGMLMAISPCTCSALICTCNSAPNGDPEENPRTDRVRRRKKPPVSEVESYKETETCDASCVAVVASVAIVVSTLAFVAVLIVFRQVKKRQLAKHRYVANRVPLNAVVSDYVDDRTLANTSNESSREVTQDKPYLDSKWEFRRDRLIFQETLGEGEFGKVIKAQAWNIAQRPGYSTVAVKTLKDNGTSLEEQDLLSELNLLREVSHPNVIQLLGACTTKGGPLYVIVEYAELGSLRAYLRKLRQFNNTAAVDNPTYFDAAHEGCQFHSMHSDFNIKQELLSFSWQIAKGMAYLSEMKLVHRDLAARNILLTHSKVVKISDFGLSRDVYEGDTYLKTTKGRVPIKWMAIESLEDQIYTTKSDVWSFGVVLWEIINLGATPYPGVTPERVYHLLKEGYRMPHPDGCSQKLYKIMRKCWKNTPQERPNFKELVEKLDKLLQDTVEYLPLGTDDFSILFSHYECPIVSAQEAAHEHRDGRPMSEAPTLPMKPSRSHRPPIRRHCDADENAYENGHLLQQPHEEEQEVSL